MLFFTVGSVFGGGGAVYASDSDNPSVTIDYERSSYDPQTMKAEIYVSIDKSVEGDIDINFMELAQGFIFKESNRTDLFPGDKVDINIYITNNSPNPYEYSVDSLSVDTIPQTKYLTDFIGYDGNKIGVLSLASIAYGHPAIKKLFGKTNPSGSDILGMYDKLKALGFTGDEPLGDYILQYYRNKHDDQSISWDTMRETYREDLINDFAASDANATIRVTKDELDALDATSLSDYLIITSGFSKGKCDLIIKYPEQTLGALSYDLFNQDFWALTFGDEATKANPNRDTKLLRTRGIGDYLDTDDEAYQTANDYLKSIGKDGRIDPNETVPIHLALTLDGPGIGNSYQTFEFTCNLDMSLTFRQTQTSFKVDLTWDDQADKDRIRPDSVVIHVLADGEELTGRTLTLNKSNNWTAVVDQLPEYRNGEKIVYTISADMVAGYTASIEGDVETGYKVVEIHTPKDVPPTPADTPSKVVPTGDNNGILPLYVALLGIACSGIVFMSLSRRINK